MAEQVTVWPTVGGLGKQEMPSRTGSRMGPLTLTSVESESSPTMLETLSVIVRSPAEVKVVVKLASDPPGGSPPPRQM